jgi:hypothetical protein
MANSDNKAFNSMFIADKTAVSMDNSGFFDNEYLKELSKLPYSDVKNTHMEKDWFNIQENLYGSISKDQRNLIQIASDKLYESGPVGAAASAVADIVPGIPFVDIIDPPEQLSGRGMQKARNILGVLSLASAIKKAPQAAGRVATNIREPYGYGVGRGEISSFLPQKNKLRAIVKSISEDKPIYFQNKKFGDVTKASSDAREFLYRRMFGLEPRRGKNIFIENPDGTLSFNPASRRGRELLNEVISDKNRFHSVMARYDRTPIDDATVQYEDIWDFKLNPGEIDDLLFGKGHFHNRRSEGIKQAALRTTMDLLTTPQHIKGKVVVDPSKEEMVKIDWNALKNILKSRTKK